ncbi:ABC transporter substrate-binding protein [Azospirillum agricola]|uniref:ABC transporter substrate-binding protein n=1 Tax=Azospirillum agricola TaxID=1720247 RepID=UPI000A0F17DC|nr:ABC transporter substrate-binding protein [Azospirillum agricola]SMH48319.1 ABC-type nitrate/sulfonate/bicarbonate transport system, substrate-binding protein [Azospirillum lipoferum]
MSFRSLTLNAAAAILALSAVAGAAATAQAADAEKLKLGFAKCAHCLPMALTPGLAKGVEIEAINFNSGNDVLTALVSKSIDVAQVTYLHYITALDKGFDVVAVSGQVNGGSEVMTAKGIDLKADDWDGLKALIAARKEKGEPLRVAASRGNAQDIHMRGAFQKHGINVNKDVQFVNIPNPSDHAAALQRGEIDLICTVEPFASQIRNSGAGTRFALPYDQAAGNLTNLIVTRSDVIKEHPKAVEATVGSVVALVETLKTDRKVWVDTINKYTGMDRAVAAQSLENAAPDYAIHKDSTLAIAAMMRDLKYITRDVTADAEKNIDYRFLEAVTNKPKSELGF